MNPTLENSVAAHYGRPDLYEAIVAGLDTAGVAPDSLAPADLAPVDEFHTAGRSATLRALAELQLEPGMHVLDAGAGIGGTARCIASEFGCTVAGVDLTPEYVEVATRLTDRLGLAERCRFHLGSVLALPFEDATFDAAVSLHVAMNIADRPTYYHEIARTLRPGARALWFDVMKGPTPGMAYPVPWATSESTSFLFTLKETTAMIESAGFDIERSVNLRDFARAWFKDATAKAGDQPPPLGLHLLTGADSKTKFARYVESLEAHRIEPVIVVARRRRDG